jgi:hypothetical protein
MYVCTYIQRQMEDLVHVNMPRTCRLESFLYVQFRHSLEKRISSVLNLESVHMDKVGVPIFLFYSVLRARDKHSSPSLVRFVCVTVGLLRRILV